MKKHSYISLAVFMAVFLFASPLLSFTPFDDSTVNVNKKSNSGLETADINATSEEAPKNKDYSSSIKGTITASALNIRSYPWGDIIGTYHKGDQVDILGELGDWYKIKYNGQTAYIHANWVTTPYKQGLTAPKYGVVTNCYWANVHRTPSGDKITQFQSGTQVYILGEVGEWYKIKYNDNEAFIAKNYVDPTNFSSGSSIVTAANNSNNNGSTDTGNAVPANNGTLQQNIVTQARALVGSTAFRTADVDYGNLACAKVATTALKNAGALDAVYLDCRTSVRKLKEKGWVEVTPPPYQEGDVITWKTYDYTGDGIKDEDTHIGIIVKEGNTYMAMNNSSSLRTPRISAINGAPISRVLRKA